MYTHIDPQDETAVIWLQTVLSRLVRPAPLVHIGALDALTGKALRIFQHSRSLPVTGEADDATLQRINQELAGK